MQAEESIQDEIEAAKVCKRRVDHLHEIESQVPAVAELWRKKRIDRMIVDHFLRAGYYTTAMKLAKHSHIEVCYIFTLRRLSCGVYSHNNQNNYMPFYWFTISYLFLSSLKSLDGKPVNHRKKYLT